MDEQISEAVKEKIMAVGKRGSTRPQAAGYFRVALGLYYLDGVMTDAELDFKKIDRNLNRFIYHALGKGHSITSVLQFMSGKDVVAILESPDFLAVYGEQFGQEAVDKIPFLLSVNLGVAKKISGLPTDGPVKDWIGWR